MYEGKSILAVVPARSGSKGIVNKNMYKLGDTSLIGLAGKCLNQIPWIDKKIISTDSEDYMQEGNRYFLDAPFKRTPELSSDSAGAIETIRHALIEAERIYRTSFDIVLIVEPTSPLREPEDIIKAIRLLVESGVDSVVTVSPLITKYHPAKILAMQNDFLYFYESRGAKIVNRQSLEKLYWRNGICYVLTRDCLISKKAIFTDKTIPLIIEREIVNIDDPIELKWAEFLLEIKY